uniref:Tetratricopeptide TPR_2 repeat protein n=1 Tax=Solibacter usitatus (strain Ellin6076) TaxID=234267 RepID=Q01YQ8_SOLUE
MRSSRVTLLLGICCVLVGNAQEPAGVESRLEAGNAAVRAGQYEQAIAAFQALIPDLRDPEAAGDLFLRLGETYRRNGDLAHAVAALRQSAELRPGNERTVSTLALALDAMGRKADAAAAYREVLELNPINGIAVNNLAYILAENGGDLDDALQLARRALELLPDLPEVSDTLGWIYLKKNQAARAAEIFSGLVEKHPFDISYHYRLGMALTQLGDNFAASGELRAALKLNPPEDLAARILHLLMALGQ